MALLFCQPCAPLVPPPCFLFPLYLVSRLVFAGLWSFSLSLCLSVDVAEYVAGGGVELQS